MKACPGAQFQSYSADGANGSNSTASESALLVVGQRYLHSNKVQLKHSDWQHQLLVDRQAPQLKKRSKLHPTLPQLQPLFPLVVLCGLTVEGLGSVVCSLRERWLQMLSISLKRCTFLLVKQLGLQDWRT